LITQNAYTQNAYALSIKPREKPEYLEKALNLLASYSSIHKLLVVFDEVQEVVKYSEKVLKNAFVK
jgi:hypothetical protein